jgi:hypothetical protein
MSLERTQIARPKASATIGGQSISPESVRVTASINSFARVDLRYHNKTETNKAISAVPETLSQELAADQKIMFEAAEGADISIEDGLGGTLKFKGYQTNSSYEITPGAIGYAASIVHNSAVLDTLQTSVYKHGNTYFRDVASLPKGGEKYSSWMSVVLEKMISSWDAHVNGTSTVLDDLSKAEYVRAHENNARGLAAFRKYLAACNDPNPKLSAFAESSEFLKAMNLTIFNTYGNSYGSFLQTIQQLGLQFQTIYVPDLGDGVGTSIVSSSLVKQELSKKVHILSMLLSAGAKNIIPMTQVILSAGPSTYWRADETKKANKFLPGTTVSVFPPGTTQGRVYVVSAPGWLPTSITPRLSAADIEAGKGSPDPAAYGDKRTMQDEKARNNMKKPVRDMMDEWAKNVYVDMALADSVAQITVPLDLTWELGKVYKVTTTGAKGQKFKKLFTGFLSAMSHNLSSIHDSPHAYTSLMFTHVQGEGFTLPGLE